MENLIAWLALGISLILMVIKIIETIKYWKRPKIEICIGFPEGKLKIIKGEKIAELKVPVTITNKGNEDTFIDNLTINHQSMFQIISNRFKLASNEVKFYEVRFSPNYTPKEYFFGEEHDSLHVQAIDKNGKKHKNKIYYEFLKDGSLKFSWLDNKK